jgi:hypothetical protein
MDHDARRDTPQAATNQSTRLRDMAATDAFGALADLATNVVFGGLGGAAECEVEGVRRHHREQAGRAVTVTDARQLESIEN